MTGALVILGVTLLLGLVLYLTHRPSAPDETAAASLQDSGDADGEECCGRHAVCEKKIDSLEPVYFDDEELDRFAGREPDTYTDGEIEEFRRVLYTLLPADVYPWGASLTLRGVALPDALRDEWLMLCEDTAGATE